jgi:hypothetical protein
MNNEPLLLSLQNEMGIDLAEKTTQQPMLDALTSYINELIQHNFQRLVQLLYRIDVNEARLKHLLRENKDKEAASIIAALIVERLQEKIKTRAKFKQDSNIPDQEKW